MKTKLLSLLVVFICFSLCSCSLFVAMPAKEKTELVVKEEITIDDNKPFLERYLPFVKVDDGYSLFDAAYLKGTEFEYAAYELRSQTAAETNYDDFEEAPYWEVAVVKEGEVITVLRQNYDDYVNLITSVKYLVYELDVNFDGKNDILLHQGQFGAQGAAGYTCYLSTADSFELCHSFPNFNTAISEIGHTVCTLNRDSAAEHSVEYYSYTEDGEYVPFEAVRFMPHSSAYSIYDNAEEFLGEDMSVYDEAEYRCAVVETFNNGEWELYKMYPDENDSPYYEHKHVCYYENYKPIYSLGTELYEYVKF